MATAIYPKYVLGSQTDLGNNFMINGKTLFFFFGIAFLIHKIEGILKFYLHIIMHKITAFVVVYIERKWVDSVNQRTGYFLQDCENDVYQYLIICRILLKKMLRITQYSFISQCFYLI